MRIIDKRTLQHFWEKYPSSKQQLLSWYQVIEKLHIPASTLIKEYELEK